MNVMLYEQDNGPCPYLENRQWITHSFFCENMDSHIYENLINYGFRRCGYTFYQNQCYPQCHECVPIKIDVNHYQASKSQKRVIKKNSRTRVIRKKNAFYKQDYHLYQKYCQYKHASAHIPTAEEYQAFLIKTPLRTEMMKYYQNKKLIGLSWIDILTHSISSVYFAFHPGYSKLSLGVFSILKEIELCRKLGKKWLQLGFWVKESPKMSYKNQYKPYQLLINGKWLEKL